MRALFFSRASTTRRLLLPIQIADVRYSKIADGGDESAEIVGTAPADTAWLWLRELQAGARIYDSEGENVWRGYLESATVSDGRTSESATIGQLANQVYVQYTTSGRAITSLAAGTNTASQAQYGKHMVVLGIGESDATAAAAHRDRHLAQYAWPRREVPTDFQRPAGRADAQVTLRCRGYTAALGWVVFRITDASGSPVSNNQALVNTANAALSNGTAGNNLITATTSLYTASAVPTVLIQSGGNNLPNTQPRGSYETALDIVRRLTALGTTAQQRVVWGVSGVARGDLHLFQTAVWAGSTGAVSYVLSAPDRVTSAQGIPVAWARVRPDRMAQAAPRLQPGGFGGDSGSTWYVERTEYRWSARGGEQLTIAGDGDDGAVILARSRR